MREYNLEEGWPDEPGNEELAGFAEELRAGLPDLPGGALGRVEKRLMQELEASRRRPVARVALWALTASGAAALLLLAWGFSQGHRPAPAAEKGREVTSQEIPPGQGGDVEDCFPVPLAGTPAPLKAPGSPGLVRFDDNQSLFAD